MGEKLFHDALLRAAEGRSLSDAERRQLHMFAAMMAERVTLAPEMLDSDVRDSSPSVASTPQALPETEPAPGLYGLRYHNRGLLGIGGMGEVRRVYDPVLKRALALKVAHARLLELPNLLARFVEEAQVQAQLQHPNLVPVHELGVLADGRPYFTMDVIHGRSMSSVIADVHLAATQARVSTRDGWSMQRLLGAFATVCRAVGFAHDKGVVHRDLKPGNIMLGAFGEVRVVDWGLAKVRGRPELAELVGSLVLVETDRAAEASQATWVGSIAGTPAYMPPEQALGEVHRIDARSDVYALGAVLYELLAGEPPYRSDDPHNPSSVLDQVRRGPPRPLVHVARQPVAAELVDMVERAMSREMEARYADGNALAAALEASLDGSLRREQARGIVSEAEGLLPRAARLRGQAASLRTVAGEWLREVPVWSSEDDKAAAWSEEDRAAALEREAELLEVAREQKLQAALSHSSDLPEAHAALAETYLARHAAAEAARRDGDAAKAEAQVRAHAEALPVDHPARQRCVAWLRGTGALTLLTDPPGASVLLERYELRNRRLVAEPVRELGATPLLSVPLEMGSFRLRIRAPGHHEVLYPVRIARGQHWDGVPPDAGEPSPIWLPPLGELGPDERYVPPGWFAAGGDPFALGSLPSLRVWVDGFVLDRVPVTNKRYIAFLHHLVAAGREDEALRHAPRERSGTAAELGAMIYGYENGRFFLRPDADGDLWDEDWPVWHIDWDGAFAFAEWLARRTGQGWRLPDELEWEKAARGVDGRFYPWGDVFDPSWCCMRDSLPDRPRPAVVGSYPTDESPYGLRDMAGNLRDWTANAFSAQGPAADGARLVVHPVLPDGSTRVGRGGSWSYSDTIARLAVRFGSAPGHRSSNVGFRVARSLGRLR